jgi:hypothetical protein
MPFPLFVHKKERHQQVIVYIKEYECRQQVYPKPIYIAPLHQRSGTGQDKAPKGRQKESPPKE